MDNNYSSWAVGWAGFAGMMLIIVGVFDAIQGLVALFNDEFYVVTEKWVFEFDITAWGWIQLILGVILIASGIGIFSGNLAAHRRGTCRHRQLRMAALLPGVVGHRDRHLHRHHLGAHGPRPRHRCLTHHEPDEASPG